MNTIILDLDETLVHSWENPSFVDKYSIYSDPEIFQYFHGVDELAYSIVNDGTFVWGLFRPYLDEFLDYVNKYFDNVVIWSAGTENYVNKLVSIIFNDKPYPKIVWSRNKCRYEHNYYHKPIADLIADVKSRPNLEIDIENTLIVDDKKYTFKDNPDNGILIPAFHPKTEFNDLINSDDSCLLDLMNWFERINIRNKRDIRSVDKNHIFQPEIKNKLLQGKKNGTSRINSISDR